MKAGESRQFPVSMIHRNDEVERYGIAGKNRPAAGSQITIDYHPNGIE